MIGWPQSSASHSLSHFLTLFHQQDGGENYGKSPGLRYRQLIYQLLSQAKRNWLAESITTCLLAVGGQVLTMGSCTQHGAALKTPDKVSPARDLEVSSHWRSLSPNYVLWTWCFLSSGLKSGKATFGQHFAVLFNSLYWSAWGFLPPFLFLIFNLPLKYAWKYDGEIYQMRNDKSSVNANNVGQA